MTTDPLAPQMGTSTDKHWFAEWNWCVRQLARHSLAPVGKEPQRAARKALADRIEALARSWREREQNTKEGK